MRKYIMTAMRTLYVRGDTDAGRFRLLCLWEADVNIHTAGLNYRMGRVSKDNHIVRKVLFVSSERQWFAIV